MKNLDNQIIVSIKCLVYNHAPYIRQCLDGFVMQKTSFRFEAIVHDDASTDGTQDIIKEYAEKYPDIINPIYETENQYSKKDGSLRKIMNNACNGKYIALCEGDDYWIDPLKLQKQVDILEKHSDYTIIFNKVQAIDKEGNILNWTIPYMNDIQEGPITLEDYSKEEFFNGHWTFHTSSVMYRASIMEEYMRSGLYKFFPYGDMPLMLYFLYTGFGYYFSDISGSYRWLSGGYNSTIRGNKEKAIKDNQQLIKGLKFFDIYTKKKYSKYIKRRIYKAEYDNFKLKSNYIAIYSPKYRHFRSKMDYFNLKTQIAETFIPHVYKLYKKFFH